MSHISAVSAALLRVGLSWAVLGGCAQGFEGPQAFGYDTPGASLGGDGSGGGASTAGSGSTAGMGASGTPGALDGEPCMRGETSTCECDDGSTGSRTCAFDAASPTEGSFGDCGRCSGSAGSGGRGGASGSSASGGSGGSSGSGGSAGSASPPPSADPPLWCIFVPIPIPGC